MLCRTLFICKIIFTVGPKNYQQKHSIADSAEKAMSYKTVNMKWKRKSSSQKDTVWYTTIVNKTFSQLICLWKG